MKRKLLTIFALLLFTGFLFYKNQGLGAFSNNLTAFAVGDLNVDWGVPIGNPIFNFTNFFPGQTESHTVSINNGSAAAKPVGVGGVKTSSVGNLEDALDFIISSNNIDICGGTSPTGPKTLAQFFAESAGPAGISLITLQPGNNSNINFKATFKSNSGNELQGKSVVFNLEIGISFEVPSECLGINFSQSPIFGTEGNDNLIGTAGNDIILAFNGKNRVNGLSGDDCIMGGSGEDRLSGGNGEDMIFGLGGNDDLNGSNGDDKVFGNEGNDKVDGSNGVDLLFGGIGNDNMNGSNGNDQIFGEEGNDNLKGSNGDDKLDGQEGIDVADGNTGKDICLAETRKKCEF